MISNDLGCLRRYAYSSLAGKTCIEKFGDHQVVIANVIMDYLAYFPVVGRPLV